MGNCCSPAKSSTVWAGDDWGHLSSEEPKKSQFRGGGSGAAAASSSSSTYSSLNNDSGTVRQVKIKITRKELQELVENAIVHGVPAEQGLARLINEKGNSHLHAVELSQHQHPWKPILKSIPE